MVSFIRKFESKKIYTSFPFYCIGPRENDLTRSDLDTRGISFVCVQNTEFDSSQSVMSVAHITNHDVSFPSQYKKITVRKVERVVFFSLVHWSIFKLKSDSICYCRDAARQKFYLRTTIYDLH